MLGELPRLGAGALRPALGLLPRPWTEGEPIEPDERPADEPAERPMLPPPPEGAPPERPRWAQAAPSRARTPDSKAEQKRS